MAGGGYRPVHEPLLSVAAGHIERRGSVERGRENEMDAPPSNSFSKKVRRIK